MPNQSEESSNRKKEERPNQKKASQKSSRLKQKNEPVQQSQLLSQSLQSLVSKAQTFEADCQIQERNVQELSENCQRQLLSQSDIVCDRNKLTFVLENEAKAQDAVLTKQSRVSKEYNLLRERFTVIGNCMHKTVDIQNSYAMGFASFNEASQQMHNSVRNMHNVALPSLIEHLQMQLSDAKDRDNLSVIGAEEEFENNLNQNEFEEKLAVENLSNQRSVPSDMQKDILALNEDSEKLLNDEAGLSKEMEELKHSLNCEVGVLTEKDCCVERDIQVANEERVRLTLTTQNQQIALLQKKDKEGSLLMALEPMKANVECLAGSLLKKQTNSNDISNQLDVETKRNAISIAELNRIQLQLHDLERTLSCQIEELSVELLKSANATEMEISLQEELKNWKTEEADLLKEEDNLQQTLIRVESQIQESDNCYSQACQSIIVLENTLDAGKREIDRLDKEVKNSSDRLATVRCAIQAADLSLTQTNSIHENCIYELKNHLVFSEQEKCEAVAELESLNLTETELNGQIAEAERVSAYSDAEMKEYYEKIIKELNEEIVASEDKFESTRVNFAKDTDELQKNVTHVNEAFEKRDVELISHEERFKKSKSDQEDLKVSLQATLEQKEKQAQLVNELILIISDCHQKQELQNIENQSLTIKLEQTKRNIEETDCVILSFETKLQHLKLESENIAAGHKTEKQVFLRDLVTFQNTADCRRDEQNFLRKQTDVWKNKYENFQKEITEINNALQSKQEKLKQPQEKTKSLESKIREAKDRQDRLKSRLKSVEIDALNAKKKSEHLKNKLAAHRAKKQKERRDDIQKNPPGEAIPPRQITPQFLDSKPDDKENTPRSILKSLSKPPTPKELLKTVRFVEDDDTASSSSSIVMVQELTDKILLNPGARQQIVAEHREALREEKKKQKQQAIDNEVFKLPSQNVTPSRSPFGGVPGASGNDKENIPWSISKPSSMPSSPQEHKTLAYEDDFDDGASSSSSIVMVPELTDRIALNPGAKMQIVAEHRQALREERRKRKHQEISQVVPTNNTTPQFALEQGHKEITPRSILKSSSKPPTPKKTVTFMDFDDDATSSSSAMISDLIEGLAVTPRSVQQEAAEHFAAKRMKLNHWDDTNDNQISSSTPEK